MISTVHLADSVSCACSRIPTTSRLGTGGTLATVRGRGRGDLSGDGDPRRARPVRRQPRVARTRTSSAARARPSCWPRPESSASAKSGSSTIPMARSTRSIRPARSRRSPATFAASSRRSSITFGPDGAYGHPDHIAISQLTTAAIVCAADPSFGPRAGDRASRIACPSCISSRGAPKKWTAYQAALRKLVFNVDGEERQAVPWPDWAITTVIDTSRGLAGGVAGGVVPQDPDVDLQEARASCPTSISARCGARRSSTACSARVNGGRARESDLFEGLR